MASENRGLATVPIEAPRVVRGARGIIPRWLRHLPDTLTSSEDHSLSPRPPLDLPAYVLGSPPCGSA